jgi:hypothetical protein
MRSARKPAVSAAQLPAWLLPVPSVAVRVMTDMQYTEATDAEHIQYSAQTHSHDASESLRSHFGRKSACRCAPHAAVPCRMIGKEAKGRDRDARFSPEWAQRLRALCSGSS